MTASRAFLIKTTANNENVVIYIPFSALRAPSPQGEGKGIYPFRFRLFHAYFWIRKYLESVGLLGTRLGCFPFKLRLHV